MKKKKKKMEFNVNFTWTESQAGTINKLNKKIDDNSKCSIQCVFSYTIQHHSIFYFQLLYYYSETILWCVIYFFDSFPISIFGCCRRWCWWCWDTFMFYFQSICHVSNSLQSKRNRNLYSTLTRFISHLNCTRNFESCNNINGFACFPNQNTRLSAQFYREKMLSLRNEIWRRNKMYLHFCESTN